MKIFNIEAKKSCGNPCVYAKDYVSLQCVRTEMYNLKNQEMDETIEMQIKFKEELLRQYKRLSDLSGISDASQEATVNRLLDELSELYKKRKQ